MRMHSRGDSVALGILPPGILGPAHTSFQIKQV